MNREKQREPYHPGQTLSWYHGHAYLRVVKVLKVEESRVLVRGASSDYWIRRRTLDRNLAKADPVAPGTSVQTQYAG